MNTVVCHVGGKARGNPGLSAIGVRITDLNGVLVSELSKTIGNATNNFAEYNAVMVGLQTLQSLYGSETQTMEFELQLSNEVVQKQLNAESTINDPGLVPMFIEIHNMRVAYFPQLTITLVSEDQNKDMLRLVIEVLDGK